MARVLGRVPGYREVTGALVTSLWPGKDGSSTLSSFPQGVSMRPGCLVCKLLATPSPAFLMSDEHNTHDGTGGKGNA